MRRLQHRLILLSDEIHADLICKGKTFHRALGWTHQETEEFFVNKAKVTVYFGEHFGGAGKGYFRLNAGIPKSLLKEVLNRIESALMEAGAL